MSDLLLNFIAESASNFSAENISMISEVAKYVKDEGKEKEIKNAIETAKQLNEERLNEKTTLKIQSLFIELIDDVNVKDELYKLSERIIIDQPYD